MVKLFPRLKFIIDSDFLKLKFAITIPR